MTNQTEEPTEVIDITKVRTNRAGQEVIEIFHYPDNQPCSRILVHLRTEDGIECHDYFESGAYWIHEPTGMDLLESLSVTKIENIENIDNGDMYEALDEWHVRIKDCHETLGSLIEEKANVHK